MSIEPSGGTVSPAAHTGEDVELKTAVAHGMPTNLGLDEPRRVADTVAAMELVSIRVNGTQIRVSERVTVREIVEKASEAGAISGVIEEYVIERVEAVGEHGLDEEIEVQELEEFMAIPIGKTEVAHSSIQEG